MAVWRKETMQHAPDYSFESGKLSGQIIVNDINTYLIGTLTGIAIFVLEILHHKVHVALDLFVVGLKIFLIIILYRPSKIFVFQKRFEHFFLEIMVHFS